MTTIDQLYSVQARQNEIWRRLKAGSLNVEDVLAATQGILDGIYPHQPVQFLPTWYVDPELRLALAFRANDERRWGFTAADFPSVPEDSRRLWLLVVNLPNKGKQKGLQRTVDEFWDVTEPPAGYTKYRRHDIGTDSDHLRLAPGYTYRPGIYWVEFNPDAYQNLSPTAALEQSSIDGVSLAGTEVLHAIWQFPDWVPTWFKNGKPAPNLSGLQFRWDNNTFWSLVPCLNRWDVSHQLKLNASWADYSDAGWASPSVREC